MEFNFIHKDSSEKDIDALFGPKEDHEVFVAIDDNTRLETLIVDHIKKFKSLTQARKNGWGGDIPLGFKAWKIGKTRFWTYKPLPKEPDE